MADSQLILELMFLYIRGGCSLTVLLFFLTLVEEAVSMIHTSRIKDNWTPKFLAVEQFNTFDRAVTVYKSFNKLCPENLWNKYHLRSHCSRYNTRFCRNIQINLEYAIFEKTATKFQQF